MSKTFFDYFKLLFPALLITIFGLVTMNTIGESGDFFSRQLIWLIISLGVFFSISIYDYRTLQRSSVIIFLFILILVILSSLFAVGAVFQGAARWFDLGWFAIQPTDLAKLILILVLAKYFSRRHIEIAAVRHTVVSFLYTALIAGLLILQPDLGSAVVVLFIWLGMIVVSGIPFKQLLGLFGLGIIASVMMWSFVFEGYQKQRVITFLDPYADITGSGYNVYQSLVAVGSGGLWGKGVGEGTQSRLQFLPEAETDFIFAAFVEEWGLVGAIIIFCLFAYLIAELTRRARQAESNFEALYLLGLATLILGHFFFHVGINLGVLPATGITLPFMSYGGSHLITTYAALGLAVAMSRRGRIRSSQDYLLE